MSKSWYETICCCCCCYQSKPKVKRTITLGCFGVDGAGKSTFLKMLKGEDPRNVLTTNGFSVLEMEYDANFDLKIFDVGGDRGIRDIWSNYYGEVYGIIFVVDYSTDETFQESVEALNLVTNHPHCAKKPILFVINNKNNKEFDDVEFSNVTNLQATSDIQQQMVMVTHINKYNGYLDNIKNQTSNVYSRFKKDRHAFQDQFVEFIELIVEHFVYLSEGVRAAELALKIKQQAEKDKRKMLLMKEEHDARKADIAALEGRTLPPPPVQQIAENEATNEPTRANIEEKDESAGISLASSTIPSDIIQGSPDVTPPPDNQLISQTSTKPVSPEDVPMTRDIKSDKYKDGYFLPPKSPGRQISRIQRIQSALNNRVAPT